MTFAEFASMHGLLVQGGLIQDGHIHSCPTVDKPHKRNGRYCWNGRFGWIQNWRLHTEPIRFADERAARVDLAALQEQRKKHALERAEHARQAAQKAAGLLKQAALAPHPYLAAKGFPKALGLVLPEGEMVVPMRDVQDNALRGAQIIQCVDNAWEKKILFGTRAKGAVLRLGRGFRTILVEGYATGLSVRSAAEAMRTQLCIMICFSAGNLIQIATPLNGPCYVVADHDASGVGEQAARETGRPWIMPPEIGQDANDLHQQHGIAAVVALLQEVLRKT